MWTQVKDCSLPILGDLFFIILVLWGSFFTLNLLLAVLEVNFSQGKEDDKVRPIQQQHLSQRCYCCCCFHSNPSSIAAKKKHYLSK